MARTLVLLRDGPAVERGWLGLRSALALVLAGHEVTVALLGDAVGLALAPVTPWLGGDVRRELEGLVGDLGRPVLVDAAALRAAGAPATALSSGCVAATDDDYSRALAAADLVIAV